MKKFKVLERYSDVKVLEFVRNKSIKINGFTMKRGFVAFQDCQTGEFLGFSSGWTCNGYLAVYIPSNSNDEFDFEWIEFDDIFVDEESLTQLEKAVLNFGQDYLSDFTEI